MSRKSTIVKNDKSARNAGFRPELLEARRLMSASVWATVSNLPLARGDGAAVNTYGGVELFGGTGGRGVGTTVLLLDPTNFLTASSLNALDQAGPGLAVGETVIGDPASTGQPVETYKYASDIFAYGGNGTGTTPTSTVENYVGGNQDAETIAGPSMSVPRSYFAHAVDPATGNLFAIGGLSTGNKPVQSAEVYDPSVDAWSAIAAPPASIYGAAGVSDGAGHIFTFGGQLSGGGLSNAVYQYTIATNSWTQLSTTPVPVTDATVVYGAYGTIYVVGGKSTSVVAGKTVVSALNSFYVFDPVLNNWTAEPSLPLGEYGAAGVVDSSGDLDVIGGFNSAGTALSTSEMTPSSYAVTGLPQPPVLSVPAVYSTYSGTSQPVAPTAFGTDGITPVAGSFTITYNGSTTPPINAGTYSVIAQFNSADPGYVSEAVDSTVTIYSAAPTLTVDGGGTITYNGQPHPVTASAVGVDGQSPVAGSFGYTYNGSTTPPTTWGVYTATATFTPTDGNYASSTASTTITIPDPRIVTGVAVVGVTTSSLRITWNPVTLPSGVPPLYDVYEQIWHPGVHDPKGSGGTPGTMTYTAVGSLLTTTSLAIGGLAAVTPISGSHSYVVTSVDTSVSPVTQSVYSAVATGSPLFAPSFGGTLIGGAVVLSASVEVGSSVQITPIFQGNASPTFSLAPAAGSTVAVPASMTIDPTTGVVTYAPVLGESGTVNVAIVATNTIGTATTQFSFTIIQRPTIQITGGTFAFDGNTHGATAVAYDLTGNPIAGTFSFEYSPIQYPTTYSTAPYAEPGTYNVLATFVTATPGYGGTTATASGAITIDYAATTLSVPALTYLADGNPHPATATALASDGITAIAGVTTFAYNGSAAVPTTPGVYSVVASFVSSDWEYGSATAAGTLTLLAAVPSQPLSVSAAGSYFRVDSDGVSLDIWNNPTGTGALSRQVGLSTFNGINVVGSTLTVDLGNGPTLPPGGISFAGNGAAGTNALTVIGTAGGADAVVSSAGQISVDSAVVHFANVQDVAFIDGAGTDSLAVNGGALHLGAGSGRNTITPNLFSGISIGTGGRLVVDNADDYGLRTAVDTQSLAIAGSTGDWTGTLDLGFNDLIVETGTVTRLTDQIALGYNLNGGANWLGAGITSSAAAGDTTHLTALGVIPNTVGGSLAYGPGGSIGLRFDSLVPSASAVLIRYTFFGDANLDGVVDGSDYSLLDSAYSTAATGWLNGDFSYDQSVDGTDYALIDNAFNNQRAAPAAQTAAIAAVVVTPPSKAKTAPVPLVVTRSVPPAAFQSQSPITPQQLSTGPDELLKARKDRLDVLFQD